MEIVTKEQFKTLRNKGFSSEQIKDLANRGRIYETLNKESFKQKGLFRAAGEFLGMEEFGRGIGTAWANMTGNQDQVIKTLDTSAQIHTNLLKRIKEKEALGQDTTRLRSALETLGEDMRKTANSVSDIGTQGLNNREVIGSAFQTGLSVVGLRGGLPTAKGVAAKTGLGKIGAGAVSGAMSGAAYGGAEALTEGENVFEGALKGGAFGGAVGGAIGAASKFVDELASKSPKNKLFEQKDALKTLKRSFNKNTHYQTVNGERRIVSDPITTITKENLTPKVVDGKIVADKSREQIRQLINDQNDDVLRAVENAKRSSVPLSEFKDDVVSLVKNNETLKAGGRVSKTLNQVDSYFDDYAKSYGNTIDTKDINAIRVGMNKVFNPDTVDIERSIGDAARKIVYSNAPGSQELLRREGQLIAADKFLDALDGRAVKGGRLGKYFANLVGAMAGSTTQIPVVGPVAGALGANKIADFAQKSALDPLSGKAARGILSIVEQLPTDNAGNISKTVLLNLLGQLVNQQSPQ